MYIALLPQDPISCEFSCPTSEVASSVIVICGGLFLVPIQICLACSRLRVKRSRRGDHEIARLETSWWVFFLRLSVELDADILAIASTSTMAEGRFYNVSSSSSREGLIGGDVEWLCLSDKNFMYPMKLSSVV